MKKKLFPLIALSALAILIINLAFDDLPSIPLQNIKGEELVSILGGLLLISLLVERTAEIFIPNPKQDIKDALRRKKADLEAERDAARNATLTQGLTQAGPAVVFAAAKAQQLDNINESLDSLSQERQNEVNPFVYGLSLLISLVGFRILSGLLDMEAIVGNDIQMHLLLSLDIIMTSSILAGGSGGIHDVIRAIGRYTKN